MLGVDFLIIAVNELFDDQGPHICGSNYSLSFSLSLLYSFLISRSIYINPSFSPFLWLITRKLRYDFREFGLRVKEKYIHERIFNIYLAFNVIRQIYKVKDKVYRIGLMFLYFSLV